MSDFAKGLEGVIANETRLGDVRGQEGQLIYCGFDINELAGKASHVFGDPRLYGFRPVLQRASFHHVGIGVTPRPGVLLVAPIDANEGGEDGFGTTMCIHRRAAVICGICG